jgi:glycosyltransferase involved in cell wall biosynthesis
MIPVTVLVTTRNEELNIEKCLKSVYGKFDQIFVIDSESSDRTVELAKKHAEVLTLLYDHTRIIPWIFQWGLENLPIRNEWVLILEADQEVPQDLFEEIKSILARPLVVESGFYIRRKQFFQGKWIRFGGYGSKHLLKLFRRSVSRLDPDEQDTRVYVDGFTGKLRSSLIENNLKESSFLFYIQKHLRYAEAFAREERLRRIGRLKFKADPALFGTSDQRVLRLKSIYYRLPLYIRPLLYFLYRYFLLFGFLDGRTGFVFHYFQSFWFRLLVDIRLKELLYEAEESVGSGQGIIKTRA